MRRKRLNALIRRAITGDATAMEQLCQLYAKTILFQVRLLVRNKDEAEDVAQRVAIEMLRSIQNLRSPYAFRSWLQRLIINACNKQNTQTQRESERTESLDLAETVVDGSPEAQPENEAVSKDMRRYVGGYLEKLPPAQAVTLTMYYYEQLSYKEIAAALGVSIGSVASTIAKAKKNLKRLLKENGEQNVLGILFIAPFMRGTIGKIVCDEVTSGVSSDAVDRFMAVCQVSIVGRFTRIGSKVPPTIAAWKTILAVLAALTLLGGLGAIASLITHEPVSPEPIPAQEQPVIPKPESRVTYSIEGERPYDDPINPLTAQIEVLSNERIIRWELTDSTEAVLITGHNDYLDIASLGLADGSYVLSWYLVDDNGLKSRVFWEFDIATE